MPDPKKPIHWARVHADYLAGMPVKDICRLHGCGRSEMYKRARAGNWTGQRDHIADSVAGGVEAQVLAKLQRIATLSLDITEETLLDWQRDRRTLLAPSWDEETLGKQNGLLHSLLPATLGKALAAGDKYLSAILEGQADKTPVDDINVNIHLMGGHNPTDAPKQAP